MGELDRVREQVGGRIVADCRGVASQQSDQLLRELLGRIEAGVARARFEQRPDPRQERLPEVEQPAERQSSERHLGLEHAAVSELVEPVAELVEQTDQALRREQVEAQELIEVLRLEGRRGIREEVGVRDADRRLRTGAGDALSADGGGYRQHYVERAGRRVQTHDVSAGQLSERDPPSAVVIGIVERRR